MAIKLTGLQSGLDTESIIKEMMTAHGLKKTKVENKKTKLEWQQEKWKELNTKIYKLYTDEISKMRLQSSYATRKVTSSNANKVTATAGTTAPVGTQSIQVNQLASSQNVTGGAIKDVTEKTKLSDVLGAAVDSEIIIKNGEKEEVLQITSSTTVKDFLNSMKTAGLNASFDEKQGRFFISSKSSGAENAFSITTSLSTGGTQSAIEGIFSNGLNTEDKKVLSGIYKELDGLLTGEKTEDTIISESMESMSTMIKEEATASATATATRYLKAVMLSQMKKDNPEELTDKELQAKVNEEIKSEARQKEIAGLVQTGIKKEDMDKALTEEEQKEAGVVPFNVSGIKEELTNQLEQQLKNYVQVVKDKADPSKTNGATELLQKLGLDEITGETDIKGSGSGMSVVVAKDSIIMLNGAELTGTTNTITANGISYELKGVTEGETIELSVSNDTQKVYDSIKGFVNSYNTLLKEMNGMYDADSAKGYDPLTEEEREAMSDEQIEKWENKIKDSLLRRDSTLGSIMTAMKTALNTGVQVDGKTYTLASFGITTSSSYNEKGLLHIHGDADDDTYSNNANKLMAALEEDPELVQKVLTEISKNLYDTVTDKMKSTTLSSALTVYNDKQMEKTKKTYDTQISKWETKLEALEAKYYKQFAAMESAMASLNSQSSALSSLLGM